MNTNKRSELLSVVSEIILLVPYLRFGQILALIADRAELPYANAWVEAEDQELLPAAREYLDELKALPEGYLAMQIQAHRESASYPVAG